MCAAGTSAVSMRLILMTHAFLALGKAVHPTLVFVRMEDEGHGPEAGWTQRPGGRPAEMAVLLARRAAGLHRATAVSSAAGPGTALTLTFGA